MPSNEPNPSIVALLEEELRFFKDKKNFDRFEQITVIYIPIEEVILTKNVL